MLSYEQSTFNYTADPPPPQAVQATIKDRTVHKPYLFSSHIRHCAMLSAVVSPLFHDTSRILIARL